MSSIQIPCDTHPDTDYLFFDYEDMELTVYDTALGRHRHATVSVTPHGLYRLVRFITENVEKTAPFQKGDVVRCPSGCVALVNQVEGERSLITTPANVSEWIDNEGLELLYRDSE